MQRRHLPTLNLLSRSARVPRVDVVRARLGGRAQSEPGAGAIVRFYSDGSDARSGVVLFVAGDELEVWTGNDHVLRLRRDHVQPRTDPVEAELQALASEVRAFARLQEGARVRYRDSQGMLGEGRLVEKCRYGALVLRDDRHIVAVGFRNFANAREALGSSRPAASVYDPAS